MRTPRSTAGLASVAACTLALVAGALAPAMAQTGGDAPKDGAPSAAGPATSARAEPKVAPELAAAYATAETADVWVRLVEDTDLTSARRLTDDTARGREVVADLKATAADSQAPVRSLLRAEGLRTRSFWVTNAVFVQDAPESVVRTLAARADVAEVRVSRTYAPPEPVESEPASAAAGGLEWGVANINADDVWAQTGRSGEGVVIANIDTGVQFDHPALVRQYRGNNGDGTFTHDYNWFDTSGACEKGAGPCDKNGHGTHTMGTMAGDDGAGNQIGVAPGVRWITANGCATCSDVDLLAASQWMLAPTDANGQNPDPARRPDIVNNSWGSVNPSDEPLFEDVQEAWAASGIMGIWSNGNEGPACRTSGTPGSRTLNYSVGAYDSDNTIASFSSRGPGQDGTVKPDISAPGVNIRSAAPGNGYQLMSGTSMAAPHTAGAVALLWSARPEYAHDIQATRDLLDLSAIDTDDTTCGGTAANNNVYGEGRLDALALVNVGVAGTATLSGTVTDADTGQPLPGAEVSVTGPVNRRFTVPANGTYTLRLVAGDYQVSASAFGYVTDTTALTLTKDQALTHSPALNPTQRVDVTGKVTDGSGQGWGLAAKVVADDGRGHRWSATTDPSTGAYTLPLLPDTAYTLTYTATEPGYDPTTRTLTLGTTGRSLDVGLTVALECTARGYQVTRDGTTETFSQAKAPRGWTVTNVDPEIPNYRYQPGWQFTDPGERGNHTGGDGSFAIVDSRNSGKGYLQDTYLTSPTYDMTGRTEATIDFGQHLEPAVNSTTSVDLSLDGGRTWETVWSAHGYAAEAGTANQVVAVPQAADRTTVRYRLHYRGQNSGWWAVDNAFIGDRTCTPTPTT
ncbi:hypothetical protein AQ490_21935 [Wenjunlia vitaminophila]|uniref:Peptidase S8/S53 domain-containing protein n=1 Tax=Wenjunlia vitaminophila TaxID=76728 RepID=A0A0T6LS72_WENVI|nr:S8 family serine peptidase [Wenjunlia vitaminophila]KRV48983.1 hypothetical protein AQ490_21935 [Wenjunlia vitaminophila]